MLLVMLTSWLKTDLTTSGVASSGLELVEYFAGKARITKMALRRGYRAKAIDIEYTKPKPPRIDSYDKPRASMDFNGHAGFVFLGSFFVTFATRKDNRVDRFNHSWEVRGFLLTTSIQ